jgi:arylsulfatase A-like enzyme
MICRIMRNCTLSTLLLLFSAVAWSQADTRPNIILIVADDLGFSDIGAYGSEIRTPSLDFLAKNGVQLTSYHTSPTCGPTRAMLMTGVDHHRAGIGTNAASLMRLPELQGRPGYEGYLNDQVVTFSTLLNDAGYHTYMTGKWDLGIQEGKLPVDRGFDKYFGIGNVGASHFPDKIGTFYMAADANYFDDDKRLDALPEDFFSSRTYTDRMLGYINQNSGDGRPYMAYLAYTAPHWPLQVPDDWLDRYDGQYDIGWHEVQRTRFNKQKDLGVIPSDTQLPADYETLQDWDKLASPQRDLETRRMEIYAAMVENMDYHIGRLLAAIEDQSNGRETVVIFVSDNGSEGNDISSLAANEYWVPNAFDNRLENLGREGSYVWLGRGWGQTGSTPFSLYKSFVSEGGIRTPAVFYSSSDRFDKGIRNDVVTIRDIAPTILELAGVEHPGTSYGGREIIPPSGKSTLSYLRGNSHTVHGDAPLGWELYGNRALIKGDWKALLNWAPEGTGKWQLFDLKEDPTESHDLSASSSRLMQELIADWNNYAEENGVATFDRDLGYGRYR